MEALSLTTWTLIYSAAGCLACIIHPHIRATIKELWDSPTTSSDAILRFLLVPLFILVVLLLWPIAIFRCKASSQPTLLERTTHVVHKAVIDGYRYIADANHCAPTAKTSDAKIIEIYSTIVREFRRVAEQRREILPAVYLNFIALKFFQVHEQLGPEFFAQHLQYELQKYAKEGLRPDYQRELELF